MSLIMVLIFASKSNFFYDHVNPITRRTIDKAGGGKLRDTNNEESWALLEDLAPYDNESWNDLSDFSKLVKAISLPQDVPSTSDLVLTTLNIVWKIPSRFVNYAFSRTDEAGAQDAKITSILLKHLMPNGRGVEGGVCGCYGGWIGITPKRKNPTSTISDQTIENLKDQLVRNEVIRVKIPRYMSWLDAYDEPLGKHTAVTYPDEVEEIIGIPIEVEPLDETPLEDLGLNTCNHDIPLSFREIPNFDEPEPQPQPLPSCSSLEVDLGEERGPEPPVKPPSPDSFRMKEVDNLTNHTLPSPHVASFHPKDTYCYYHPCLGDPKKHYGFEPGLLGQSGSIGVDFSNMEMIENDWELESKEVSFLGKGLNSPVRPKEVEKVKFDEEKPESSYEFHVDNSWMTF
ncbi:hypothetical protein Tco_1274610 [Tanacetum coccineum]